MNDLPTGKHLTMAISNELSSEIAAAILQENKSPQELEQLKEVVLQVHCALQEIAREARIKRFETKAGAGKGVSQQ